MIRGFYRSTPWGAGSNLPVCSRQSLEKAVRAAEEWLAEGRSEYSGYGRKYALENPLFLHQQYTGRTSILAGHIERLRNYFKCKDLAERAKRAYQDLHTARLELAQQIRIGFGQERMRAGMFAGLEGLRARARRRRPQHQRSCGRVWVKGYYR